MFIMLLCEASNHLLGHQPPNFSPESGFPLLESSSNDCGKVSTRPPLEGVGLGRAGGRRQGVGDSIDSCWAPVDSHNATSRLVFKKIMKFVIAFFSQSY